MVRIEEEMIKLVDKEKFLKLVKEAQKYCPEGDYESSKVIYNKFLERWAISKSNLFLLFGKKLTLKCEEIDQCIDENDFETILNSFSSLLLDKNEDNCFDFVSFLLKQNGSNGKNNGTIPMVLEAKNNLLTRDCQVGRFKFKKGEKISKMFASFVEKEKRELFLTLYSTFIQKLQTPANLLISIDPCEILTCSLNKHNWGSCYTPSGEYFTGAYSYLMDKTTAIAFTASDKLYALLEDDGEEFLSHNSKSWRQFVHIDTEEKRFFQTKQYPNVSITAHKAISTFLIDMLDMKSPVLVDKKIRATEASGNLYIDYQSTKRDGSASYYIEEGTDTDLKIQIGARQVCLMEGCDRTSCSDSFFCGNCSEKIVSARGKMYKKASPLRKASSGDLLTFFKK